MEARICIRCPCLPGPRAVVACTLGLLAVLLTAAPAAANPLASSRKCRAAIAQQGIKLAGLGLALLEACHRQRNAGKRSDLCLPLAAADPKGKLAAARAKAQKAIDKVCAPGDPVRGNFPGGLVATALLHVETLLAESAAALRGAPSLAGDKQAVKCHAAVGKAQRAVIGALVKDAAKCQKALDKRAVTFGGVAGACVGDAAKAAAKARAALVKACRRKDGTAITGPEIGSCSPLPDCVLAAATATGQALATGIYAQPNVLLEGDPGDAAAAAFVDFHTGLGVPADGVSTNAVGVRLARTIIEIAFVQDATVAQVNELLESIGGSIDSMLEGVPIVVVRVPDPGSLSALEALIADLEARPLVRSVNPGYFGEPDVLPPNFSSPVRPGELNLIHNHLAVRAHAAWNAIAALDAESVPLVLVADAFGHGSPFGFPVRIVPGGFGTGNRNEHGYHVLGIIGAEYGGPATAGGRATGIFPMMHRYDAVDIVVDATAFLTDSQRDNLIIQAIKDSPHNVVLNTSLGFGCTNAEAAAMLCTDANARYQAAIWIEKVRGLGSLFAPDLEGKFLHVNSAGNVPPDAPGVTDTTVNDAWAAAKLLPALETDGLFGPVPLPNLTNTLVVENIITTDALPYVPDCLNSGSKHRGDLAAVGTAVWSYTSGAAHTGFLTGTSMASPQVAGLAAFVWTLKPSLTPQEVLAILEATARDDHSLGPISPDCNIALRPAPIIDAYAAVLATDEASALAEGGAPHAAPVRLAILDVANAAGAPGHNGAFDQHDVRLFLAKLDEAGAVLDYSRYDLNGDGRTGGDGRARVDLDISGSYGTAVQTVHVEEVDYDETALTDLDVLCFYAYSPLYGGDEAERDELLLDLCLAEGRTIEGNVTVGNDEEVQELGDVGRITGNLVIATRSAQDPITSLRPLGRLKEVGGALIISGNPALESLDGLSKLARAGSVAIIDNPALLDIDGLRSLTSSRRVVIRRNASLANVDGLIGLEEVGPTGDLEIVENDALADVLGLVQLADVHGNVTILKNGALTDLDPLESLRSVFGTLQVGGPNLISVAGLRNLEEVGALTVSNRFGDLPSLGIFELPALVSIQHTLRIEGARAGGGGLTAVSLPALTTNPDFGSFGRVEISGGITEVGLPSLTAIGAGGLQIAFMTGPGLALQLPAGANTTTGSVTIAEASGPLALTPLRFDAVAALSVGRNASGISSTITVDTVRLGVSLEQNLLLDGFSLTVGEVGGNMSIMRNAGVRLESLVIGTIKGNLIIGENQGFSDAEAEEFAAGITVEGGTFIGDNEP
jgi:hypothetical protein